MMREDCDLESRVSMREKSVCFIDEDKRVCMID